MCPRRSILLWLLPPLLTLALRADEESASLDTFRDALYLEVFKRPAPRLPVNGFVQVSIDGGPPLKLPALIPPDGEIQLDAHPFLDRLAPLVQPEIIRRLEQQIGANGRLGATALQAVGLAATFDPRRFMLSIVTPVEARGTRVSHLSPPPPDPFSVDALRPADVSGFLNFNLKGTARGEATFGTLALDGALNLRGLVLEGSAYARSGHSASWQRGDLRLVYDRPRQALRFTAGDLSYPVLGYQTMTSLFGVGVARDFALQPQHPTWRTNQFEFHLDRPSEVKVWVNESLVRTLRLPAGAHDLRGLNAAAGQNEVRLEIEDDAGRRESLEFSFLFNPVLLERGRQAFTWNAGFQREPHGDAYHYDTDRPVLAGSVLTGWTDHTTLGTYAQLEHDRSLLGVQALHSFRLATLRLDTALARSELTTWDVGSRLELSGLAPRHSRLQSQFALEYLGRNFVTSGPPAARATLGVRASVATPLGRKLTGRLSGSYTPARRPGLHDACLLSATLTHRWNRHVQASLALRHRRTAREAAETELRFGLRVIWQRGRSSLYAAKELETDAVTMRWDSGRSANIAAPYGFAEVRLAEDIHEYRGAAGYAGYRGLAELEFRRTEPTSGSTIRPSDETALRLQGSLVFADGTFAFARPVTENFAIVAGQHGLRDVPLRVDPDTRGGSRARSSRLGPAVLEDLSSYRLRDLRVEPVNPPLGATPDNTAFTLAPAYKSGVLLRLGREPLVVAIGRLVDDEGEPLPHLAIEIRRPDRPDDPPLATFTSRSGAFQLPDLRPGRYEIRALDVERSPATVEVTATSDSLHRLGSITLPRH